MKADLGAYVKLAAAMALVGSSVVVGKLIVASFPIFLASGLRFLVALAVLLPLLLKYEKRFPAITPRYLLILFLQAFSGIFLFSICLLYGLKLTTATSSGIITSTTPAVVGILSFAFLKDRFTWHKGLGISLAVAGIMFISIVSASVDVEQSLNSFLGNLLILGAVCCEALFIILAKVAGEKASPLTMSTMVSIFGLLLFLPFSVYEAINFSFSVLYLKDWLFIVYYGVVVTVIAFILWFQGLSRVPASTAAVFTGVLPVSAVLLSYLILKESFFWFHLAGMLCVLLGIVLIAREPLQNLHV